jgi:hypothetical protein
MKPRTPAGYLKRAQKHLAKARAHLTAFGVCAESPAETEPSYVCGVAATTATDAAQSFVDAARDHLRGQR